MVWSKHKFSFPVVSYSVVELEVELTPEELQDIKWILSRCERPTWAIMRQLLDMELVHKIEVLAVKQQASGFDNFSISQQHMLGFDD